MIRATRFRMGQGPEPVEPGAWHETLREEGTILWIDAEAATKDEFWPVARQLGIDTRAAERVLRVTRPAMRVYHGHYLITAQSVQVHERHMPRIDITEIDTVVGRGFILTVHDGPVPFLADIEERVAAFEESGAFDAAYVLFVLLDTLVSQYTRELDEVEDRVERLEEQILTDPGRGGLTDAVIMQRHIHSLRRIISPHLEPITALIAPDSPVTPDAIETYFRDILARLNALLERLDHVREIVTGAYDLYISNVSERSNQELRVLTFLSAIFLPMTVVTGIFGTNFKLAEYDYWQPFYVMVAGLAMITVAMLVYFRLRRWL